MPTLLSRFPVISLLVFALISGLLWRLEVEYRGWAGLGWLRYFHFAIPLGFGLFILWGNALLPVPSKERLWLNIGVLVYGIMLYRLLNTCLTYTFAQGRADYMLILQTPDWALTPLRYAVFALIPLIPIGAYAILRVFKLNIRFRYLLMSVLLMVLAAPISVLILELIHHKGGQDYIHAIKSGIVVPWCFLAVGLLVLGVEKPK